MNVRTGSVALLVALACAGTSLAGSGNGAPNGAHFNLNIIGSVGKSNPYTDSNRHSIFVALGSKTGDAVTSRIYLTQGPFAVCDGNAFDAAYSCDGNKVAAAGAVFQLPCNTNIPADITCAAGGVQASYEVWARALGTPGGHATMTTCATDPTTGEVVCSTESVLLVRNKGQQKFSNVTNQLTSIVTDLNGDGTLERVALFAGDLQDFFWMYDNNGLKLAQLRFYLLN